MRVQAAWRKPEQWRLLFHCFSNTGWYTFGAVMEGLLKHAAKLLEHVIGSVIDSAPHAEVSHPGDGMVTVYTQRCSDRTMPCNNRHA